MATTTDVGAGVQMIALERIRHDNNVRDVAAEDVAALAGSKHRAWWSCAACGHQWQAAVHNRARGSGCPVCGLKRRARTQSQVESARSLAIKHPDLPPSCTPSATRESIRCSWARDPA